MTLMIAPIKTDMHLNDTEVSFLLGLAFVCIYAFSSLPIARLADSASRKIIVTLGLAFWSLMTTLCGVSQGYGQLFLARMGVGAGESTLSPASYSILADSFPREKLATATGYLGLGVSYGSGIALIVGGQVIGLVSHMPDTIVPGLGVLHPWQWAFVIVGLPGLLVALVMQLTIKEPLRRGHIKTSDGAKESMPIGQVIKYIFDDWPCFGPIFVGMGIRSLGLGAAVWLPEFFRRTYEWSIPQIGLAQGIITLASAPAGVWLGGYLSARWTRKNIWDCNLRLAIVTSLIALPTSILYPLSPSPWLALGLMAFNSFLVSVGAGPGAAALQLIVPNQMRGQINSLNLLIYNFSAAFAPTFVALFTDFVFHNEKDLRFSIVLVALAINPISLVISWLGLKPYARSVKRAHEQFS